jgi:uncharacterized RDD family membrane protein YckC
MDKKLRPSIFKRLLALIVDFTILGILGYISGLFLEDFYVSLGKYGTLIGSSITIVYFSILQSSIGKGQTLGKKAIGAKVTDLKGEYLSLDKSFLRSFIVFFPIMNVEIFSGGSGMLIILMLLMLTIFASFYFILVNKSRRCLHDILINSIVTNKEVIDIEIEEQNDRSIKKLIPIGVIGILMIGMGIYQTFSENTLSQLLSAKEKIENVDGVITVNEVKSSNTTYSSTNEPSRTYSSVQITVRIDDKNEASNLESKYFDNFYQIIKDEVPESEDVDGVSITLYYGYNIGIASKTQSVTKTFEK